MSLLRAHRFIACTSLLHQVLAAHHLSRPSRTILFSRNCAYRLGFFVSIPHMTVQPLLETIEIEIHDRGRMADFLCFCARA
jgi:hypothetical protein